MMRMTALMLDGDAGFRELVEGCAGPVGWELICAHDGQEALRLIRERRPPVVFLEVGQPGPGGLETLREIKRRTPEVRVVVVSTHGETETVVEAMKLGAADFLIKPIAQADVVKALIDTPPRGQEDGPPRAQVEESGEHVCLVGDSPFLRGLLVLIDRVADTEATILLQGESGVGKGMVARMIHARSLRRHRPFVKVNCAALPAELLEAELFGYERGAFTGAVRRKPGKFELAHGGTLFLDEVGEIPLGLQAKLLHVLQDSTFSRLGGETDVRTDTRVIAASNRNLEAALQAGFFRPDLYFRLNVVGVSIPPLRERREEIPALTHHFHSRYCKQFGRSLPPLPPALLERFLTYAWPGNIRELENAVKRIVLLGPESGLPPPPAESMPSPTPLASSRPAPPVAGASPERGLSLKEVSRRAARDAEREMIGAVLKETRWNRREAARRLGISYKALLYKIRLCGLLALALALTLPAGWEHFFSLFPILFPS